MSYRKVSLSYIGSAVAVLLVMLLAVPEGRAESAGNSGPNFDIPISELSKVKKKAPAKKAKSESKKKARTENAGKESAQESATPAASENSRIFHSPYSFVVAGKRTVINAVINSKEDIKEVRCTVTSMEGQKDSTVKMDLAGGSKYTYSATLPGTPPEVSALRYTIIFVDTNGNETRSKEFTTPVSSSPLVPSWQLDSSGEPASAEGKKDVKPKK